MKRVYITHSTSFDYKTKLYRPLRNSILNSKYEFILPHETSSTINSKEIIERSDLVIAEVSFSATGVGIELGWADSFSVPIFCIYKEGKIPQNSVKMLSKKIIPYSGVTDMLDKVENAISKI